MGSFTKRKALSSVYFMAANKASVQIGCCGFRSSRESYYPVLSAVEVQHTFYQPPQISTLKKWRKEAPADFEFTIKAWQLITHKATSPTYKRLKRQLTDQEKSESGSFNPTKIVKEAWETTLECAKALKAKAILFQCPASYRPLGENIENLVTFFKEIKREKLNLCWEPRGDWPPELVQDLCQDLQLWHVVDPFSQRTLTTQKCYFRLHGRGGWRYRYEDAELEELKAMLPKRGTSYVFFNNIEMKKDALRFKEIVEASG
jgi:uncharacterized protein YecE (DUF72 family)